MLMASGADGNLSYQLQIGIWNPMEPVILILAVVSVLLAFWSCLPELWVLCRRPKIQNGFVGSPEEVAAGDCRHEVDEDLVEELAALRCQPVGLFWEKMKFGRIFHELVFANAKEPGFAILYPNRQIGPRRASFLTVFTSGAVVFTKNYSGGLEAHEDDFIAGGLKPPAPPLEPVAEADAPPRQAPPSESPPKKAPPKDAHGPAHTALLHVATLMLAALFSTGDYPPALIFLAAGLCLAVIVRWFKGPGSEPEPEPVAVTPASDDRAHRSNCQSDSACARPERRAAIVPL